MIIPTRSQSNKYDPWTDVNGDGTIDMADISMGIDGFMTSGDSTRNVNVTNWLPPKPKTVFYYQSDVTWANDTGSYGWMVNYLYVGDYTRMSILLNFTNIQVDYGEAFWTVNVQWADTESGVETGGNILCSTLYSITSSGQGYQSSTDSYAIKGPYVKLRPEIMNLGDDHKGNASMSIFLYLGYGTTSDSTLKTVNWYVERSTNDNYESFGPYIIQGFRQITITIWTNVSCWVQVGPIDMGGFEANVIIVKTYQVQGQTIGVFLSSPQSKPWNIQINFCMTT